MSSQYQPASVYTSIDANVNDTSIFDMTNESSSESVSSSLTLLIIVISSAIFVTACIYIFLRCLSPPVSTRTHSISNSSNDRHVALKNGGGALHVNLLPLFKFGALSGNHTTTGDCAVCLSKFEREDQLRLLPQCRHAFHAECIDTWLKKNQTCPLCRSTVYPTDAVVPNNIRFDSVSDNPTDRRTGGNDNTNNDNYRIEIGNISTRRGEPDIAGEGRRSYSIGSFEYIVDRDYEVSVDSTLQRDASVTKEFAFETVTEQLSERLPAEASAAERSWLKEYVDWLAPFSLNSRTTSLRSSSRFFSGSVRRNDVIVPVQDLEANRVGEEISELFQWFSRV